MPSVLLLGSYSLTFTSAYVWLVALIFLIAVAATYLYYRRTNPPLSPSRRIILGLLRGIAIAALFFAFAEPLLEIRKSDTKPPLVALLIDNSASMVQNRASSQQYQGVEKIAQAIESRLDPGSKIVRYALSDTITVNGAIDGSSNITAIGDALKYLGKEQEVENLQSVVLLSDGVSNFGINPATAARHLGVPVYSIGFGSTLPPPDIAIVSEDHNPVGFADKEFPLEVTLESRGFEKLRVPLRLRHQGKTLVEKEIDLVGEGKQQKVDLNFVPPSEGVYTLEISVPAQENEQSTKNNSRQIQVKIRKSKIKILLAAAYLNWDYKFLHQVLSARTDFDVVAALTSPQKIGGTIPFPENIESLSEYDAVIMIDFDSNWLTSHRQLLDAFFDRTGKGLFFLAGENFGRNARSEYSDRLFPYQFLAGSAVVTGQEVTLQPTDQGKIHPILKFVDDIRENDRLLRTLPPFLGYLQPNKIGEKTTVLAAIPALGPDEPLTPILGAHRYRNGKVAILSAFPFWRLDFLTKSFNENDSTYARLMENMVLWLVARDDLDRMQIAPEKPIFIAGEIVNLQATVLDESYQPISDAQVEATLISNNADTVIAEFRPVRPGIYSASLHYLPSGSYQLSGEIRREGTVIGKPSSSLIVEPYSLEDLSFVSDFDMLRRIAEVSGGKFYPVADTASVAPFPTYEPKTVTHQSELILFDWPPLLGLFLVTVCVEWFLRRHYQLL